MKVLWQLSIHFKVYLAWSDLIFPKKVALFTTFFQTLMLENTYELWLKIQPLTMVRCSMWTPLLRKENFFPQNLRVSKLVTFKLQVR